MRILSRQAPVGFPATVSPLSLTVTCDIGVQINTCAAAYGAKSYAAISHKFFTSTL